MTPFGALHFETGLLGWIAAAGVLVGGAALAVWTYARTPGAGARLLLAARLLALLLLTVLFLDPVLTLARSERARRQVAVVVDVSPSMTVQDSLYGLTRLEAARRLLFAGEPGLARRLEARFPVLYFTAAETLAPAARERLARRIPPARAATTRLVSCLRTLVGEHRELAAIVLLSDGRDLDPTPVEVLPAAPPVFAVALGRPDTPTSRRNLALEEVHAPLRALVATRVTVTARVRLTGGRAGEYRLALTEGKRTIAARKVRLRPGVTPVELAFTPRDAGPHEYRLAVEPLPEEPFREDNRIYLALTVDPRRLRVLYFEGSPRWKYRYLRQALARDPGITATFVVKTAPDRFLQQGDSPVTLEGGLPAAARALRAFDVVILGNLARADVADAQVRALEAYVSRGGGGLLFLGGGLAYGPDGLGGTAVERVLPASLDPRGGEIQGTFRILPTAAGEVHPALAGVAALFAGPRGGLYPLGNVYRLGGLKPGAELLLLARGPGNVTLPLLVVQRLGAGKTALFASDTDWRWWLTRRDAGGEALFTRLWAQILRWLSAREDPARAKGRELRLSRRRLAPGEVVLLELRGKDLPARTFLVHAPGGTVTTVAATAADGLRRARLRVERTGRYRVTVPAAGSSPPLEAHFQVVPLRTEWEEVGLDRRRLEALAARTGGAVLDAAGAAELPERTAAAAGLKTHRRELAPRRRPELFLAVAALLGLEWWIRRKRYGI